VLEHVPRPPPTPPRLRARRPARRASASASIVTTADAGAARVSTAATTTAASASAAPVSSAVSVSAVALPARVNPQRVHRVTPRERRQAVNGVDHFDATRAAHDVRQRRAARPALHIVTVELRQLLSVQARAPPRVEDAAAQIAQQLFRRLREPRGLRLVRARAFTREEAQGGRVFQKLRGLAARDSQALFDRRAR
jgi:hypothetical protein